MKQDKRKLFLEILPSIIAILIGLLCGWYVMFVTNPVDSWGGIWTIIKGAFNAGRGSVGQLFYTAAPIVLTGMAVGFSIKTGLFNIGASGQFTVGAFAAILVGCKATALPAGIHCAAAILAGMTAGALWGFISGALKAYFGVNEIISGIMLNYTGMLLVNLLIKTFVYDSVFNRSADVAEGAQLSSGFTESFLPGSHLNLAFVFAVAAVIIIKIILDRTTLGYELKITGKNRFAGVYAGIDDKKSIILAMIISGALAGLGGALMYLCDFGDHIVVVEEVLPQGFSGISVALLGMCDPIGIIIAGLFISYITVGGNYLQLYSFTPEVVKMIIAIIVFCGALVLPIREIINSRMSKKSKEEEAEE